MFLVLIYDKLKFVFLTMPENAYTTTRSKESDVYSYGVVLLELITRKMAVDPAFTGETDMVGWVRSFWNKGADIKQIVDSSLEAELLDLTIKEQVADVLQVALRCTEKDSSKRPTMRDVVKQILDACPCRRQLKKRSLNRFPSITNGA